jgi:hypothetical protein
MVLVAAPTQAAIGGKRVAVLPPFVAGATTGAQSPATHLVSGANFGFAWDIHGGASTAVYPRVTTTDGAITMRIANVYTSTSQPSAGMGVDVEVRVAGTLVGTVRYSHLVNVPVATGQTNITTGTRLGDTAPNQPVGSCIGFGCSGSWDVHTVSGIHTHMEFAKACYGPQGINSGVSASGGLALLSQNYATKNKSACDTAELTAVAGGGGGGSTSVRVNGKADFNQDGTSDFVTRSGSTWTVKSGTGAAIVEGLQRGAANAVPLVGDVNGDNVSDFVTYDNGAWLAWSGLSPYSIISQGVQHGGSGSIPLLGKVDNDKTDDFVTFTAGQWDVKSAAGIPIALGVLRGPATAIPLIGNVNGAGGSDFVTYDNGTWAAWNATGANETIAQGLVMGNASSIPMVADMNGDGSADFVVREGNTWDIRKSSGDPISLGVQRGSATSAPLVANINGKDGADLVTFEMGLWLAWDATGSNNSISEGVTFGAGGIALTG